MTPAAVGSVEVDRVGEQDKKRKWNQNWDYPKLQILPFWGLTYSQETKGHAAEEPGGHGRLGPQEASARGGLMGRNRGEGFRSSGLHKVESGLAVTLLPVTAHWKASQR